MHRFATLSCFVIINRTLDLLKSELNASSVSAVGMQTANMIHSVHKREYLQLTVLY